MVTGTSLPPPETARIQETLRLAAIGGPARTGRRSHLHKRPARLTGNTHKTLPDTPRNTPHNTRHAPHGTTPDTPRCGAGHGTGAGHRRSAIQGRGRERGSRAQRAAPGSRAPGIRRDRRAAIRPTRPVDGLTPPRRPTVPPPPPQAGVCPPTASLGHLPCLAPQIAPKFQSPRTLPRSPMA